MYQARVIYVGQSPAVMEWLCHQPRLALVGAFCPPSSASHRELLSCALHYEIPLTWASSSAEIEGRLPPGLDLALCAFFERISPSLLKAPRLGWLNLHPAPLPERPGRLPTVEGVLEGDLYWGATLHWMTEGLDEGPIIGVKRAPRAWLDGPIELERRALQLGLQLLSEQLDGVLDGYAGSEPQAPRAPHRSPRHRPTLELDEGPLRAWRQVKACEPFGGLPMRFDGSAAGEGRLVMVKSARLSRWGAPDEGWSLLRTWAEGGGTSLEARLEAAPWPHEGLSAVGLSRLIFKAWRLPEGGGLSALSSEDAALFHFEARREVREL